MKCDLFCCKVVSSACSNFCATCNFPDNFIDFRFMMFSQILMNELLRMLIHARKIFIVGCLPICCCQYAS